MRAVLKRLVSNQRLILLFKSVVLVALFGLLWYELQSRGNLREIWQAFLLKSRGATALWLLAALLLMPFNWLIEVQKLYPIVRSYDSISYRDALRAVLAGSTLSIFSPNRLGEYGGRVLFVSPANQWKALMAHLVGGFGQFVVLVVFGLLGAIWSIDYMWKIAPHWHLLFEVAAIAISVSITLIYFNFRAVLLVARRISWLRPIKRYVKDAQVLAHFSRPELSRILGWSALRYGISCCQYFFLLQFFGIETSALEGFSCIASIFLLQTCLPLPPVASFFARSNVAIWVWSAFGANEFSSLATSTLLWIINLFLPALMGTFTILYVNISKSLGYENE
jgi:Lysylphosphatidylglycerol synthase TM region